MNNKLNLCIKQISCANVIAGQTTFLRSREKKFTRTFRRKKKSIYILQVKFLPIIRMLNKITSYKRHLDREKLSLSNYVLIRQEYKF